MTNNYTFKDFPNQSHIELKFNVRDQHLLEKEEALQKYRRNVNLLTKIFAYEGDSNEVKQEKLEQQQIDNQYNVNPTVLENMSQSLITLQNTHKDQLEQFKKKNDLFKQRTSEIGEDSKITSQEEFQQFINQLYSEELLCDSHPFLDKKSNFYLQTNIQQPIQITSEQCQDIKEQLKDEQCILLS